LTQGALAEMRTLLLELRPASLTEVSLGELLRQLTEATIGRTASTSGRLSLVLRREGHRDLSPDVQSALYRIAQEALNNIARHAQASKAQLCLRLKQRKVQMLIVDDGRGFDPTTISAGHLGLNIMRERAASIGARLDIQSGPRKGTRVRVTWPGNSAAKASRDVESIVQKDNTQGETGRNTGELTRSGAII
jgi:signal transduction histidine kinase